MISFNGWFLTKAESAIRLKICDHRLNFRVRLNLGQPMYTNKFKPTGPPKYVN